MAVKQVELPTGSTRNEERKRSMVSALEREIELLKELQHENIVQYLGKPDSLLFLPTCTRLFADVLPRLVSRWEPLEYFP